MTLSEIENRIQAIIKELDELREKANKVELEVEREKERDAEQESGCLCVMYDHFEFHYSPKEEELYTLKSKIYKLETEWNDLARERLQIKRKEEEDYKFLKVFVDDKYILEYLKKTDVESVTIDFIDKYSVRVKHPDGQRVAFVTGKGISPELSVGQIIYAEK